MDWNPFAATLASGLTLAGGGWICRHYGRKWNQGSGIHMMYWSPLEVWGWIYLVTGLLFGGLSAATMIKTAMVG